ncbi:hypothetical protein VE25_04955 [Devosia geojensis]|uniref:Lipoprotein n=1 Tax=Devosia geojensis TaxID=443610 RepID=A0A0F5FXJ0_9HYPH|nr:hypothetical protein [Devosia geojensis]KKB12907.1 hypothetical protein VE25_04955 [Devosia geojensis]
MNNKIVLPAAFAALLALAACGDAPAPTSEAPATEAPAAETPAAPAEPAAPAAEAPAAEAPAAEAVEAVQDAMQQVENQAGAMQQQVEAAQQ